MSQTPLISIRDLDVKIASSHIVHKLKLDLMPGSVHAIMGQNGSGKSTLAHALFTHPLYTITGGQVLYKGQDVTEMPVDQKARLGMFLASQYPVAIPGVSTGNALKAAHHARFPEQKTQFRKKLYEVMDAVELDRSFAARYLNDGFSGGEKKRAEMAQMLLLEPEFVLLDEIDSGLDIDALALISRAVNQFRSEKRSILIITHYERLLTQIKPDIVHIMDKGQIIKSGDYSLAQYIEQNGYEALLSKAGS